MLINVNFKKKFIFSNHNCYTQRLLYYISKIKIMNMKSTIFFILSLLVFVSCIKENETKEIINFKCSDNQKVCDLSKDNCDFGLEIFKKMSIEDIEGNLFISPFSISSALSMTMNGAKQETKDQMINTLKYTDWNIDSLNAAYRDFLKLLPLLDQEVIMKNANSIWCRKGYPVLDDFLRINSDNYNAEIQTRDFSKSETLTEINNWVENKTEGKIKDILDQIPADAFMYLINAIYFKGTWMYEFDKKNTYDSNFKLENGNNVTVKMMNELELPVSTFYNEKFQAIDIPYGDSIYSMTILLPNQYFKVNDIINSLNIDTWQEVINGFYPNTMNVSIPKFKLEYKNELSDILGSLGMPVAFTDMADFSGINGTGGLYISRVIHQSYVEVDETGTEAAAATVVEVNLTSAGNNYFNANKPFVFVIRENKTNSILFIGKLMDPS